jgi:hypothetical protein
VRQITPPGFANLAPPPTLEKYDRCGTEYRSVLPQRRRELVKERMRLFDFNEPGKTISAVRELG